MPVNVKLLDNQTSSIEVSSDIFDRQFNEPLVHQVVVAYQAVARAGTRAQKNRSAVSGGGAKPWRQKGTGRARAGTSRGPIWRGGGVTFAAQPQNHSQKVNRKMYRGAMRSILSELLRQERLLVVEKFDVEQAKTKALLSMLQGFDIKDGLIVKETLDENLYLSARNLSHVDVCDVIALDPVSLIGYEKIIMTVDAVKQIEEVLA